MIISVSRRTDIPTFYSEWFFNRLKDGYVLVRNPMNYKQISRISLLPKDVECFVFWTKDPSNFMNRLDELKEFNYYFQFTLNAYDKSVEPGVPEKSDLIKTFKMLSNQIGKERVIWRYDPIILSDNFTKEHHYKYFEIFAKMLSNHTEKCVFSFVDLYSKTKRNTKDLGLVEITKDDMIEISSKLASIAKKYKLKIETCSEAINLDQVGVKHGKCIDDDLISRIIGIESKIAKDPNQREECGCVKSIDIGIYNTCPHKCKYCYANYNMTSADKSFREHNPNSELLFGEIRGDEKITDRKIEMHFLNKQIAFL